jgi:hypothetical protein
MTAVEIVDGFAVDHGFAREDMVMNALGAGFSVLRSTIPGLKEKVDFRLQYFPSPDSSFRPLSDYMGQRYLLAVKLAGFETLEQTPLRYFELQGGYFARGFSKREKLSISTGTAISTSGSASTSERSCSAPAGRSRTPGRPPTAERCSSTCSRPSARSPRTTGADDVWMSGLPPPDRRISGWRRLERNGAERSSSNTEAWRIWRGKPRRPSAYARGTSSNALASCEATGLGSA